MIILTTTYNCENYIEKCLFSIMSQKFTDFKCYITDDLSTDKTVTIIKNTIKDDSRFILIENTKKMFQPGNYDQVIRGLDIDGDEICVEVDGDDWLPNSNVLGYVDNVYKDKNIWMTSGSFKYHDGRLGFSKPPSQYDNVRKQTFTLSHIRTWKSWLWKKIEPKDLKNENGEYWDVAGDLSFMFPMFEMSGKKHYLFISETLYTYNELNPINDHKVNMDKVTKTVNKIRNMSSYKKISNDDTKTIDMVTPYRFDVIIKYLYAKSIIEGFKTDYFKEMYKEHLRLWNGFKEYDNPNKNTFESFDNEFKLIINSIQKKGFDPEVSKIPITEDKYIVNGAHRLAAALACNKEIVTKSANMPTDGQKDCSWDGLFKGLNLSEKYANQAAIEYSKLKNNVYVVTLFPSTKGDFKSAIEIIKNYGKLVYYRQINLKNNGPLNLMKELYVGEEWAGGHFNNYNGFRLKESLCFTSEHPTWAFLAEFDSIETTRIVKNKIREKHGVGNHSVHINDTHEQTLRLSKIFFNDNSIHHLNNTPQFNYLKFENTISSFKNLIEKNNLDIDDYCLVGSSPLSVYGLREGEDLDYLHINSFNIKDDKDLIHSHNEYGKNLYGLNYDEIILNPDNHFYSRGVKFASLNVIKNMKQKRNEPKDIIDINLINTLL